VRLSLFVSILFAFFCFAAVAAVPTVIASHVDVTRVGDGLENEVTVAGWAPACSEIRVEPPKTVVDFSPDESFDVIEMDVSSCFGALPSPRRGVWHFRGDDVWRDRKSLLIANVMTTGRYECHVMWGLGGGAKGPVDFAAEWRVVRRTGCDRVSRL
jgi:hypothetical protein